MRSMIIAALCAIFCLLTNVFSMTGILPNVNTAATASLSQGAVSNMVSVQSISSNDQTGQTGFFNIIQKVAFFVGGVIIGTLLVTIPLVNLGIPMVWALMINSLCALATFADMLLLWKGISPWWSQ